MTKKPRKKKCVFQAKEKASAKVKRKEKIWYIKQVRNTQFLNATNSKTVEQHNQCDKSFVGYFF